MSTTDCTIAAGDLAGLPRCDADCLGRFVADPAWAAAAEHRWRYCGVGVRQGSDLVGYGLVAPAWHRPGRSARRPRHGGADLVALWIDPGMRGHGLSLRIVQGLAALLGTGGTGSLSAVAARFRPTCLRPALRALQRSGFEIVADHPTSPRVRLHLDATVPVTPDLRELWARLTAGVRPGTPPATAPRVPHAGRTLVRGTPTAP